MLDKTYRPAEAEGKLYERWEESGAFACDIHSGAAPFTIMMPPPNVTGSLHMGHALNMTLQDVLTRYYRRRGHDALWQPGTDHAGIATQNVVERNLKEKEGKTRHDVGREKFVERAWDWKEKYGEIIIDQMKKLGTSCDWSRERFTMDEGLSEAVQEAFAEVLVEPGSSHQGVIKARLGHDLFAGFGLLFAFAGEQHYFFQPGLPCGFGELLNGLFRARHS